MSEVLKYVAEEHFPIKKEITKKKYEQMKDSLTESEFQKKYSFIKDNDSARYSYYELISCPSEEPEVNILLISKLLEQQTIATKKLSTITGIMVFSLIVSILAIVIVLVNFL